MTRRYISAIVGLAILAGCSGVITPSRHDPTQYTKDAAAASRGDLATLRADVDKDPGVLRERDWDGKTLLFDAVDKSQFEVAAYLIEKGIAVEAATKDGRTPLHAAAQHGDIPMIKLLLSHGANPNPADSNGWTPVDRAIKWGHADAAEFLRARGGHENIAAQRNAQVYQRHHRAT